MNILLEKTYEPPNLAIPRGFEGERICWKWLGGNTSNWERGEDGSFAGWLAYDCLISKLHEWDSREDGLPATRLAFIDLGIDYKERSDAIVSRRPKDPEYTFAVEVGAGEQYQSWTDLISLFDYLIDNMDSIRSSIRAMRAEERETQGKLLSDIVSRRI